MHFKPEETEKLEAGWKVILIIWLAILVSLGVYLIICMLIEDQLAINLDPGFPLKTLKYTLFGVSFLTLFIVYYLRKYLLSVDNSIGSSSEAPSPHHPAVSKYTIAVIITSALLESIGIYGVVLFFLAKDTGALYQLLILSTLAMLYFRPRKDELQNLAAQMRYRQPGRKSA